MSSAPSLSRRAVAELFGTAGLLLAVVGSGIMAERLAGGNVAVALLANTVATGAALVALISTFGPVSGAHMNPVVTLTAALDGDLPWRDVSVYVVMQVVGAVAGVVLAHFLFELPLVSLSTHARSGIAQAASEAVATFGLLVVIAGVVRARPDAVPTSVAAFIMAAYWCTSSTSFANPAVTLARALSNTFAGIRPVDVPLFLVGQLVGAMCAAAFKRVVFPKSGASL
jgi:glycerol uptake facilitator-like aquaporin